MHSTTHSARHTTGLTIGDAASYAGVTVKAIRHYHARGLLPEPDRDASGYRRYTADDVSALIRIRTLSQAGVPLARVRELLAADAAAFGTALAEIDADLRRRIRQLQASRKAVAALGSGDGLGVPASVRDYLDYLRQVGMSEELITVERDGWVVVAAQYPPEQLDAWLTEKRQLMEAPEFRWLYTSFDALRDLDPDDPRIERAVDEFFELYDTSSLDASDLLNSSEAFGNPVLGALLAAQVAASSPAWERAYQLVERRLGPRAEWAAPVPGQGAPLRRRT